MYVAQQCFGLFNTGIEDTINDSAAIHNFVGVDLTWGALLDATTLTKFRHLFEAYVCHAASLRGLTSGWPPKVVEVRGDDCRRHATCCAAVHHGRGHTTRFGNALVEEG